MRWVALEGHRSVDLRHNNYLSECGSSTRLSEGCKRLPKALPAGLCEVARGRPRGEGLRWKRRRPNPQGLRLQQYGNHRRWRPAQPHGGGVVEGPKRIGGQMCALRNRAVCGGNIARVARAGRSVGQEGWAPRKFRPVVHKLLPVRIVLLASRAVVVLSPSPTRHLQHVDRGTGECVTESQGLRLGLTVPGPVLAAWSRPSWRPWRRARP